VPVNSSCTDPVMDRAKGEDGPAMTSISEEAADDEQDQQQRQARRPAHQALAPRRSLVELADAQLG
jgi:hypothetical protein